MYQRKLSDIGELADYWTHQTEALLPFLPDPELDPLFEIADKNRIDYMAEFLIREAFSDGSS